MALETLTGSGRGNIITPPPTLEEYDFNSDDERMFAEVDAVLKASERQLRLGTKALEFSTFDTLETRDTLRQVGRNPLMPQVLGNIVAKRGVGIQFN
jgi:hypothetical protein